MTSSSVRGVGPRLARASVTALVPLVLLVAATLAAHRQWWGVGDAGIGVVTLALGAVPVGLAIVGVRQGYDETGRDRP